MHKFTTASAQRLIKRIEKRIGSNGLPPDDRKQLTQIAQKVKGGDPPRHAEETFLLRLADTVGA